MAIRMWEQRMNMELWRLSVLCLQKGQKEIEATRNDSVTVLLQLSRLQYY